MDQIRMNNDALRVLPALQKLNQKPTAEVIVNRVESLARFDCV
jgi:hypothetical protein